MLLLGCVPLLLLFAWLSKPETLFAAKIRFCDAVGFSAEQQAAPEWIADVCTVESYGSGGPDRDLFDVVAAVGTVVSAIGVVFSAVWTIRMQRASQREAALRERELELRIRQLEKDLREGSRR